MSPFFCQPIWASWNIHCDLLSSLRHKLLKNNFFFWRKIIFLSLLKNDLTIQFSFCFLPVAVASLFFFLLFLFLFLFILFLFFLVKFLFYFLNIQMDQLQPNTERLNGLQPNLFSRPLEIGFSWKGFSHSHMRDFKRIFFSLWIKYRIIITD